MNPHVTVKIFSEAPTPERLSEFDVVIFTDVWDVKYLKEVSEAVRANKHGFILAHVSGLYGSTFVDFSTVNFY